MQGKGEFAWDTWSNRLVLRLSLHAVWERDQRPAEKWSSQGRTSRTGDAASDSCTMNDV